MIRTDRIFGVVVIIVALAFIASAYNLPSGNIFDKLGPKAFPIIVGIGMIISAGAIVLKPDVEPDWPSSATLLSLSFAVVVLIGYTYGLKPLGFILPTFVAATVLSYQITPSRKAPLTGLGLSLGLYFMFKKYLGLSLVAISDKADVFLPFVRPIVAALDWVLNTIGHVLSWIFVQQLMRLVNLFSFIWQ